MKTRSGTGGRRALIAGLLLLAVVAPLLADDSALGQGNYAPSSDVVLSNSATDAVADITYTMNVSSGDLNFGGVTIQFPQAACLAPGPEPASGDCPAGPRPNLGDVVGTLNSSVRLGVENSTCSAAISVPFVLLNATVDNSAGNVVYSSLQENAEGGGTLSPLLHDVNQIDTTPPYSQGFSVDPGGASTPSPSNGLPAHVDRYPAYLNIIFDPDAAGPLPPLQPLARYSGGQMVATASIILSIPVFAPGRSRRLVRTPRRIPMRIWPRATSDTLRYPFCRIPRHRKPRQP